MAALTMEQLRQFAVEGYLVVEDVLDPSTAFAPVVEEYAAILDDIAVELFAQGRISSLYADLAFEARLIEICAESGEVFSQHFDFSLPFGGIKTSTPIYTGPAMFDVLTDKGLLDLVESVMGSEIFSCPVQHTRTKLPRRALGAHEFDGHVGTVPWHQDNGVLLPEADQSTILTIWMPMNEATIENGCLRVIPRSHSIGKLFDHCPDAGKANGLGIPDKALPPGEPVALPMKPGSVLLMTQSTVHSSLENKTDDGVRVSLDLRYQPIGQPSGRPQFDPAGFVCRSSAHPESVLTDPDEWRDRWIALRDELAAENDPVFNRWDATAPICA